MEQLKGFLRYYGRFFGALIKGGYEWPRDNLGFAFLMLVIPPVVAWLRDPSKVPDVGLLKTSAWIYLGAFIAYVVCRVVITPWGLDSERATALSAMQLQRDGLTARLQELEETKPRIVLREPGARHVETIALNDGRVVFLTAQFIKVRFANKPPHHSPTSVAERVRAKIKFFDEEGILVLEMDGRWDDSDQPTLRHPTLTRQDLLGTRFDIEEEHNLDIAFFDQNTKEFVAFNNDNYNYQNVKKPEHVLRGKRFTAQIRLVAVDVDETFSVEFAASDGSGNVAIIEPRSAL